MCQNNNITFLGMTKNEFLSSDPLFKMIPKKHVDNTLGINKYIWFSNPAIWSDAFEKYFLLSKFKKGKQLMPFPLLDRIFCSCFSMTRICEAQWKIYSSGDEMLALVVDKNMLLKELENFSLKNNVKVYIGKVQYQTTSIIEGSISKNPFLSTPAPFCISDEKAWVKMMLIKRIAFLFESEIRIILVFPQTPNNNIGVRMNYSCNPNQLFTRIILKDISGNKKLFKALSSPSKIVAGKVVGYDFTPIKNSNGRNYPRVVFSKLYKPITHKFKNI